MTITDTIICNFRDYYPEFLDSGRFIDAMVKQALQSADQETGSTRWGSYTADPASLKARGLFAFARHTLVLRAAVRNAVSNSQVPTSADKVQSKSVASESISYAVPTPTFSESIATGDLSTTIYGQEFMRLRKRAGMGMATTGSVRL